MVFNMKNMFLFYIDIIFIIFTNKNTMIGLKENGAEKMDLSIPLFGMMKI
jgi:hypothetical protein